MLRGYCWLLHYVLIVIRIKHIGNYRSSAIILTKHIIPSIKKNKWTPKHTCKRYDHGSAGNWSRIPCQQVPWDSVVGACKTHPPRITDVPLLHKSVLCIVQFSDPCYMQLLIPCESESLIHGLNHDRKTRRQPARVEGRGLRLVELSECCAMNFSC